MQFIDQGQVIHILDSHRRLAAFRDMGKQMTVQAVSCDVSNFVRRSELIEKMWSHYDGCSTTVIECLLVLQLSWMIVYLDFRENVR